MPLSTLSRTLRLVARPGWPFGDAVDADLSLVGEVAHDDANDADGEVDVRRKLGDGQELDAR